ncbi:hypothetical protein [Allobaculum sp. Allo2]|uniref:hypothetical protein n=1 Tax=Allobaculum sp. Allo2 TaxID=2853432 RepID=UPI001F60C407|nr:hypothetical protein [Allobaculum sp. Allo2]
MEKLYWAKVREDAQIPSKRQEDAGYDLYPCFEEDFMRIDPLHTVLIPLGVASALMTIMFYSSRNGEVPE